MENLNIEKLIEDLCYVNPKYDKADIERLEKEFNCEISCSTEKHNELQLTYFYEIDFGKEENFYIEIESGINNGTQVNSAEWGTNTLSNTKTIEVLKDVVFNDEAFEIWYNGKEENKSFTKQKAKIIFEENKHKLIELHRKQSYDNYVTGGGTNKTDKYYKDELSKLSEMGVFWEYVYEEKEVDCTFV